MKRTLRPRPLQYGWALESESGKRMVDAPLTHPGNAADSSDLRHWLRGITLRERQQTPSFQLNKNFPPPLLFAQFCIEAGEDAARG